ncbi:hypothetical protein BD410DRAFT_740017 [Rickenella mellea]|uniref:Mitochondrial escape protein 2 n=1 Tax=Rickenella mellea TaxID=50990 RepID=A0A4Y7QHU8_9AGAM|nr:hypothetical protein BD410DRAFT_740017 [Rickenella mellea]
MFNAVRAVAKRRVPPNLRRRTLASIAHPTTPNRREGWIFVDSVFPVRLASWDLRHYLGDLREEEFIGRLEAILDSVHTHGFKYLSVEPRIKDGGVFVKFQYDSAAEEDKAADDIVNDLRAAAKTKGGFPSWLNINPGNAWIVKGQPWREDLNRFASPIMKVSFDGPDIREEKLYDLLRPYGRIADLNGPNPAPTGVLRSAMVNFRNVRSATIAHNTLHGLSLPSSSSGPPTKLYTMYERPIKAHAVRDWMAAHPRIVFPIIFFLLGTLTYTIFDPVRTFAVEAKILNWLDYREYKLYRWIRANTLDRLSFTFASKSEESESSEEGIWKERKDAQDSLHSYLSDLPGTLTFIHGPQGSGKSRMLASCLADNQRPRLVIDCAEIYKASSASAVLLSLSRQTGYWPVFPFLNSLNNLIDIASVGLIGQKAGLSSSLEAQVKEMLEVVGTGLKGVSSRRRKHMDREVVEYQQLLSRKAEEAERSEKIRRGLWHDGRLDCVAGNGVMSELGIGDELMRPEDSDGGYGDMSSGADRTQGDDIQKRQTSVRDLEALNALPVVVIKNFATKRGKDEVLNVLAQWAATLVENQVAHVIVVSDNRENAKLLAQALPSKPLNVIALYDAESSSALSYVSRKLRDAGETNDLTPEREKFIERLGGRASDLDSLVHKVRNGLTIEVAVEDIINRGVSELRKNGFGEDAEDAKSLPWTREQAWVVMKLLAKQDEISYHDILLDFPFKGDETVLRNMEHAELITIGTHDGRPSTIRPGRPVYRSVFERLVADPVFHAIQDIAFNDKVISSAEATVRSCEDELIRLKEIGMESPHWWGGQSATGMRAAYLTRKMRTAGGKIEVLEMKNAELKKLLAKEG